jgi:anaerobic selenocysteine-containing dehydrogenase
VGQKIGDKVYQGFKPDKVNKSGLLEIYSPLLEKKGFNPMPSWMPIPEHQNMKDDELVLTTYKVNAQTHSRTQNCKWLTEIVHNNPGWINPATASKLGIIDGDKIKVRSEIGEITTFARVTEGIVPGIIAISHHCGHWEYGRYASNKKAPVEAGSDPDLELKWWEKNGMHPNWIIPNSPDPINGQQRWFDTVVTINKA